MNRLIKPDRGDVGERLDHVCQRHLAGVPWASRTKIQEWIKEGSILVNDKVRKSSDKVALADVIAVTMLPPKDEPREHEAQDIPLTVLYEDEHMMAISKPAGLVVHPAVGHRDGTLVNALLHHSKDWAGDDDRPGLVHRLDKDTTGVLVVAKTEEAMVGLQRALQGKKMTKEYWAVVYGRSTVKKGSVDLRILRDPRDRKRMTTSKDEGRESATLYEQLAESTGTKAGLSLLKCTLLTGRTHQIRVHLKAVNLPIVGDATYGSPRWKGIKDAALQTLCKDFPRQALHARRLVLRHPIGGREMEFVAPLPEDLAGLLAAAGMSV